MRKRNISFKAPIEMIETVDKICRERMISRSVYIERAVESYILGIPVYWNQKISEKHIAIVIARRKKKREKPKPTPREKREKPLVTKHLAIVIEPREPPYRFDFAKRHRKKGFKVLVIRAAG